MCINFGIYYKCDGKQLEIFDQSCIFKKIYVLKRSPIYNNDDDDDSDPIGYSEEILLYKLYAINYLNWGKYIFLLEVRYVFVVLF